MGQLMLEMFGHLPAAWLAFVIIAAVGSGAFVAGRSRAIAYQSASKARINSQPNFHGYYLTMWTAIPAAIALVLYAIFGDALTRSLLVGELPDGFSTMAPVEIRQYLDRAAEAGRVNPETLQDHPLFAAVTQRFAELGAIIKLSAAGLALVAALAGFTWARSRQSPEFRARQGVESGIQLLLFICAGIAIATTAGIIVSLFFESLRFFARIPVFSFLFGLEWNAQTNADFGAIPLFFGTFLISLIAMCVAVPIGLYAAIFLSEYASSRMRSWIKPLLELLAGIPTVVYGFFAILVIAPAVRSTALWINALPFVPDGLLAAAPTNALAAGLVMGVMIIPFVSSLSDDVINAVPQNLRDGAYAMGATKSETVKQVVMPAALPGVIAAVLLAVSRAIGETMIVVMAAGLRPQITADPTAEITTITVQIVALLTGDSEFDSPKTLSAFALGFVLFVMTLIFNLIALSVVRKYREKYD